MVSPTATSGIPSLFFVSDAVLRRISPAFVFSSRGDADGVAIHTSCRGCCGCCYRSGHRLHSPADTCAAGGAPAQGEPHQNHHRDASSPSSPSFAVGFRVRMLRALEEANDMYACWHHTCTRRRAGHLCSRRSRFGLRCHLLLRPCTTPLTLFDSVTTTTPVPPSTSTHDTGSRSSTNASSSRPSPSPQQAYVSHVAHLFAAGTTNAAAAAAAADYDASGADDGGCDWGLGLAGSSPLDVRQFALWSRHRLMRVLDPLMAGGGGAAGCGASKEGEGEMARGGGGGGGGVEGDDIASLSLSLASLLRRRGDDDDEDDALRGGGERSSARMMMAPFFTLHEELLLLGEGSALSSPCRPTTSSPSSVTASSADVFRSYRLLTAACMALEALVRSMALRRKVEGDGGGDGERAHRGKKAGGGGSVPPPPPSSPSASATATTGTISMMMHENIRAILVDCDEGDADDSYDEGGGANYRLDLDGDGEDGEGDVRRPLPRLVLASLLWVLFAHSGGVHLRNMALHGALLPITTIVKGEEEEAGAEVEPLIDSINIALGSSDTASSSTQLQRQSSSSSLSPQGSYATTIEYLGALATMGLAEMLIYAVAAEERGSGRRRNAKRRCGEDDRALRGGCDDIVPLTAPFLDRPPSPLLGTDEEREGHEVGVKRGGPADEEEREREGTESERRTAHLLSYMWSAHCDGIQQRRRQQRIHTNTDGGGGDAAAPFPPLHSHRMLLVDDAITFSFLEHILRAFALLRSDEEGAAMGVSPSPPSSPCADGMAVATTVPSDLFVDRIESHRVRDGAKFVGLDSLLSMDAFIKYYRTWDREAEGGRGGAGGGGDQHGGPPLLPSHTFHWVMRACQAAARHLLLSMPSSPSPTSASSPPSSSLTPTDVFLLLHGLLEAPLGPNLRDQLVHFKGPRVAVGVDLGLGVGVAGDADCDLPLIVRCIVEGMLHVMVKPSGGCSEAPKGRFFGGGDGDAIDGGDGGFPTATITTPPTASTPMMVVSPPSHLCAGSLKKLSRRWLAVPATLAALDVLPRGCFGGCLPNAVVGCGGDGFAAGDSSSLYHSAPSSLPSAFGDSTACSMTVSSAVEDVLIPLPISGGKLKNGPKQQQKSAAAAAALEGGGGGRGGCPSSPCSSLMPLLSTTVFPSDALPTAPLIKYKATPPPTSAHAHLAAVDVDVADADEAVEVEDAALIAEIEEVEAAGAWKNARGFLRVRSAHCELVEYLRMVSGGAVGGAVPSVSLCVVQRMVSALVGTLSAFQPPLCEGEEEGCDASGGGGALLPAAIAAGDPRATARAMLVYSVFVVRIHTAFSTAVAATYGNNNACNQSAAIPCGASARKEQLPPLDGYARQLGSAIESALARSREKGRVLVTDDATISDTAAADGDASSAADIVGGAFRGPREVAWAWLLLRGTAPSPSSSFSPPPSTSPLFAILHDLLPLILKMFVHWDPSTTEGAVVAAAAAAGERAVVDVGGRGEEAAGATDHTCTMNNSDKLRTGRVNKLLLALGDLLVRVLVPAKAKPSALYRSVSHATVGVLVLLLDLLTVVITTP